MSTVIPVDIEAWLCNYLRSKLSDVAKLQVGNRESSKYDGSYPMIVVTDTGGQQVERVTFTTTIAVNVLGWTRTNSKPCADLSRRVYGILTAQPDVLQGFAQDSPILTVDETDCLGPYAVNESASFCRYYMTFGYILDGIISQ